MLTRRCPPPPFVSLLALWILSAAGCASFRGGGDGAPTPAQDPAKSPHNLAPPPPPTYVAPAHRPIGRVLHGPQGGDVAVVELSPFVQPIFLANLEGRALLARNPETLEKTATLIASKHRDGAILGVYVRDGRPSPGDEVALSSEAPSPQAEAPAAR